MLYSYQLENGFTSLKNQLSEARAELAAWDGVKVVTKKNGEEFASFARNFTGCKFRVDSWHLAPYELTAYVYYRDDRGHFNEAWLNCFENVERDGTHTDHPERIYKRGACLKDGYAYTVEEFAEIIEARREYLRGRIARLTDAVDHFDTAKAALLKVCEIVEDLNNVNPDLYYTAREILRKS